MALKKSTGFMAAMGLALFCVVAVAMVIAARQPSQPADVAALNFEAQPETAAAVEPAVPTEKEKKPVAQAQAKKMAASKAPAASAAPASTPAADERPARTPARTPAVESTARETATVTAKVTVQESPDVTITGCLERDADTFRLKDTSGVDAPKSRSWKSGFLRRGSARIEVIDAANSLNLPSHVGQRISVTGMLVDREMHAHSLEFDAVSCK